MKMIHLVVGIVVATVLLGSVMVPVINTSNFTKVDRTVLSNEGTPLIKGDVNGEYTIQWDSALPGMVKVNGNVTTVYFAAGSDATVSPESKEVTTDLTYGDLPIPTRTGYTFDGWYTDTNYTTEVTENTIVTSKSDIVLYAKWVGNEYTITFDADGGSVSPATKTVTFGQAYGELPTPTYTGHIFGGWFNDDDEVITASNIVDVADDQTLTAVWTLEKYTVSFTTDGHGTVDVQSLQVDYGTAYTVSSNTIVIGETTITATATSPYVFDHWTPGTSGTITESTTFMAYFNDPPVTITFTAQSPGSVSSASIADVPRGTQYVVADNVVTITGFTPVTASLPDGYYMTGWNIAQGVGTVSDAMTFTAQYEMIEIAMVKSKDYTTWVVTTDGKLFGCGYNASGQQGDGTTTNVTTFTQRLSGETIASVSGDGSTTWAVTTDGKLFGCGKNQYGGQGDGTTTNVKTFTQRGTPGSVNIPITPQIINLTPIINPNLPFNPVPITPMSVTPADIVSTDYTFLAGGSDWLLCTVSVGVDQYALALYYAGLDEPLLWDQDVTMVFSNGSMIVENNGQSYTLEYTSIFFKGNGDYVLMSESAYVWDDTEIIGYSIPTTTIGIEVIGDISSLEGISIADDTVTFGDASVTVGNTDYDHVKTISELGITYNTDQSAACTSVIVPKSVVITNVVENDAINSILSVMPVLIIVALIGVVAAVVLVRSRA